jgi:hypothetical protein
MRIYETITLPVVMYGCETWSLVLGEEHRLRVSENRMLRRIFRPQRDKVRVGGRKLHNEVCRNLYSSPNIIKMVRSRRMRWAGNVARTVKTNAYRLFVRKSRRNDITRKAQT